MKSNDDGIIIVIFIGLLCLGGIESDMMKKANEIESLRQEILAEKIVKPKVKPDKITNN